jgi:hypothetical protein
MFATLDPRILSFYVSLRQAARITGRSFEELVAATLDPEEDDYLHATRIGGEIAVHLPTLITWLHMQRGRGKAAITRHFVSLLRALGNPPDGSTAHDITLIAGVRTELPQYWLDKGAPVGRLDEFEDFMVELLWRTDVRFSHEAGVIRRYAEIREQAVSLN